MIAKRLLIASAAVALFLAAIPVQAHREAQDEDALL
jgi:hypothetical protein